MREKEPNWEALWSWAKDRDRKPPELAFTEGLERNIADLAWFLHNRERERCIEISQMFRDPSALTADKAAVLIVRKIQQGGK